MNERRREPPEHKAWSPGPKDMGALDKQVRAAEYTALYLDRIDAHLERIADALVAGDPSGKIAEAVRALGPALAAGRR